ncbi:IS110 family transposase [Caballeronia sp. AZ7_KS35]|uniref:IS110 family transposase n=1 Tax=Caballeronia sp. AZ7_KS35 TaxID=2921762 RepID=UPI00202934B0|nr:IS110 family transposase [Caballeronia sp. AZ7_KS35]
MNYSGIDLHSNNSVVTVTDEADRVLAEKRLPNDLPEILAFLSPWKSDLVGEWSSQPSTGTGSSMGSSQPALPFT